MSLTFKYATTQKWLITEDYLRLILEITSRTNPSLTEIEAKLGHKLENRTATASELPKPKGARVIPIIGPIVRYASLFDEISGATSLSTIKQDFISALEDDSVTAIVMNVDSPGGEASGINEFSEMVFNSRGIKPIVSYVSNMACSAAYWIASSGDRIVCDETATLGSIGCAAVVTDTTARDKMEGIQEIEFVSSNSPNKRPDVTTDKGKALIQEQIDVIGDIFIDKVARNRSTEEIPLTSKDVIKNFNKGGVLIGKDAVKAGLADSLGSFESVLQEFSSDDITSLMFEKENSMKVENTNTEIKAEDEVIVVPKPSDVVTKEEHTALDTAASVAKVTTPVVDAEAITGLQATNKTLAQANQDLLKRLAALEATSKKAAQEALAVKAENIALGLKGKMIPSQKDSFVAQYIQAANDDSNSPVEGSSRVDNLMKVWEEMPDHKLTEELLEDTTTLSNETLGEDEDQTKLFAELDAQASAFAKTVNKKA